MKRSFLAALILLLSSQSLGAQLSYTKGQNVSPGYEGWEQNEDGSFNLLFGYMNRNWLEEVDAPIGPGNMLSPGRADQGQPTHFCPGGTGSSSRCASRPTGAIRRWSGH